MNWQKGIKRHYMGIGVFRFNLFIKEWSLSAIIKIYTFSYFLHIFLSIDVEERSFHANE